MRRYFFYCLIGAVLVVVLSGVGYVSVIGYQVFTQDARQVQREAIDRITFSESPVYYDDGETPIGVFFDKVHRKYIPFREIPWVFVKALVAVEDKRFFDHHGFDARAIMRAVYMNLRAGRVVQGGSTLTQQTAKNIFERRKRTYTAKLKELFQAFLLEHTYSKEEIFEFYANQFFVTGFGKGLGVAAEYFFDKPAQELNLVEAAFIAGAVKGPNRYNPFFQKTPEAEAAARQRAKERKDYVLSEMWEKGLITERDYSEARAKEVPFREGVVTYRLNVILDYIREQLESDYFKDILKEKGIENIAASGIEIYTSINEEMQSGALESLRSNLSHLDVTLSGYHGKDLQARYAEMMERYPNGSRLPVFARITNITVSRENPQIAVARENGTGIIGYEGMTNMGEAWLKWKDGPWAIFNRNHVIPFLKGFHMGDIVPVRIAEMEESPGTPSVSLDQVPALEGGVVVLQNGMIRAMAGGYFNRFFNRAVDAKRQLGSIFKPIVYAAALQLKWNMLDELVNMRDLFTFEDTAYVPKPDHTPESDRVSLAWAGVKSENLATVWLLYHLTDKLNTGEFREVARRLGLHRGDDESYEDYVRRIRDGHGVVVNRAALMNGVFEEAKKDVEADLIFMGHEDKIRSLRRLHYDIKAEDYSFEPGEAPVITRLGYTRLRSRNDDMKESCERVNHLLRRYTQLGDAASKRALVRALQDFAVTGDGTVVYGACPEGDARDLQRITLDAIPKALRGGPVNEVLVDGILPSSVIEMIQSRMAVVYRGFLDYKRYDFEVLEKIRDFRTLVNLTYVTLLARKLGISTELDAVLSFPLGANSVSITEAAAVYSALMTGKVYRIADDHGSTMTPIITKIVDRNGDTIWEYKPQPHKVLPAPVIQSVTEILHMVMEKGTGRKARDAVRLVRDIGGMPFEIPIPTFGKTGTANNFMNSSFVGFIPGHNAASRSFDLANGYVIAGYVGYDDNTPMTSRRTRIYGASGALPVWTETVNAVINSKTFAVNLADVDIAFGDLVLSLPSGEYRPVVISAVSGLPVAGDRGGDGVDAVMIRSYMDAGAEPGVRERIFVPFDRGEG